MTATTPDPERPEDETPAVDQATSIINQQWGLFDSSPQDIRDARVGDPVTLTVAQMRAVINADVLLGHLAAVHLTTGADRAEKLTTAATSAAIMTRSFKMTSEEREAMS